MRQGLSQIQQQVMSWLERGAEMCTKAQVAVVESRLRFAWLLMLLGNAFRHSLCARGNIYIHPGVKVVQMGAAMQWQTMAGWRRDLKWIWKHRDLSMESGACQGLQKHTPFAKDYKTNEELASTSMMALPPVPSAESLPLPTLPSKSLSTSAATLTGDDAASQIILNVETIPGSNIFKITNIEISRPQPTSSSLPGTSSNTVAGVKEFFLSSRM